MATDRTGILISDHWEEIGALNWAEETCFCAAMPVVYDTGVGEGGKEGDTAI